MHESVLYWDGDITRELAWIACPVADTPTPKEGDEIWLYLDELASEAEQPLRVIVTRRVYTVRSNGFGFNLFVSRIPSP